jgi:hypothetical protein
MTLLCFPSSVNYLIHSGSQEFQRLSVSDVELGSLLQSESKPGDVILHPPNRGVPSLASHLAHRPAVLCYFGRDGHYARDILDHRARSVRLFYSTKDAAEAKAILSEYNVKYVLTDKGHSIKFGSTQWLRRVEEGERYVLYRVDMSLEER